MLDSFGREIDYMRISITDRCNLRCVYCMPEEIESVPMDEILTYEEIVRVVSCGAELGIKNLKVTGGEPLVRKDCAYLVGALKRIPGIEAVTLTTNGVLLKDNLDKLMDAGVDGINISLDAMDRACYAGLTGFDCQREVMKGLEAAVGAGVKVKINAVSIRGINEEMWPQVAELARTYPVDVRFIEMMPIGYGRRYETVNHEVLRTQMHRRYPGMEPDVSRHGYGPAVYEKIPGFRGSIGFISAIHGKFCDKCNRIRLTAQGYLKPCLCYEEGVDLKAVLRGGGDLRAAIGQGIAKKPAAHCFERPEQITEHHAMRGIGG